MMIPGAGNPGEFREKLFDAAARNEIKLDDYLKINQEFSATWSSPVEPGMKSPKQLAALDMLEIFKAEFPDENIDAAFQWNDKDRAFKLDEEAGYEGFEYRPSGNLFFDADVAAPQVLEMLNFATDIARYDGMQLGFDPITKSTETDAFGEKLVPDARFNARDYFRKYLRHMKDRKEAAESARALLDKFAGAQSILDSAYREKTVRDVEILRQ